MASRTRGLFQSPLRLMLVLHGLFALVTLVVLVASLVVAKQDPPVSGLLNVIGTATLYAIRGRGGELMFLLIANSLVVLAAVSCIVALTYGKWGLPGHLQGRSILVTPFLAAVYFVLGRMILLWVDEGSFEAGWRGAWGLLSSWQGPTLMLLYAAMTAAAIGIGWAIALAVTYIMRSRGRWETIGYVEQRPKSSLGHRVMRSSVLQLVVAVLAVAVAAGIRIHPGPLPVYDLASAASIGNLDEVWRHIHWRADVNAKDMVDLTPLHWVKSKRVAELLIAHGAKVNARGRIGLTPLHLARSKEIAQVLIAHGAGVNARCDDGSTPLHCESDKEIAELLITAGADVNARNNKGQTPLQVAVEEGEDDVAALLRRHGATE